jgi:type IV secretory pathway VirB9-like protein
MKNANRTVWLASTAAVALSLVFGGVTSANAQIRPPFGGAASGGGAPAQQPGAAGGFGAPAAGGDPAFVSDTEQDLNAMAAGQFPEMERSSTLPIGAIQNSWNKPFASSGQTSPGVMRYVWRPDFVMPIRTREFMTTTIELPAWEKIDRIILGDTMVFEATRVKENIVVVRPSHSGADTNMTMIGVSGNLYNFYLRSEGWNSARITDLAVYVTAGKPGALGGRDVGSSDGGWFGASNKKSKTEDGEPEDYLREIAFDPANIQFNMRVFAKTPADIEISPLRVFSDGVWTYFDYGDKADTQRRPVVFQLIDGVETMVNTRTAGPKGNMIVAEAVGDFVLRNGRRIICVYRTDGPKAFDAAAVAPRSFEEIRDDATNPEAQRGQSDYGVPPQLELANKYKAYSGAFQATDR